jgi:hypothetical protein
MVISTQNDICVEAMGLYIRKKNRGEIMPAGDSSHDKLLCPAHLLIATLLLVLHLHRPHKGNNHIR